MQSSAPSIHSLTSGLAAGDARAVEVFYRTYFDVLYAHARRATRRDEAFCLDVVQEAVLRVLRNVRAVRDEQQFNTWLRLVVQSTAYDLLRSESRRSNREKASANRPQLPGEDADEDRLQWLRNQIAMMDRQMVRMIEMRFEHRWTLGRIAEVFGLTIGTIDGRLRRALADLRRRAMEDFHE